MKMEKFYYKPSFSYWFILLLVLGGAAIYIGATQTFTLAYKRLVLLEPPNSGYTLLLFGTLLVLVGIYNLIKWLAAQQVESQILLTTQGISFPVYSMIGASKKECLFDDVTELYEKSGDEFVVVIYTRYNHRYAFDASYFENEHTYNAFAGLMNQHCSK